MRTQDPNEELGPYEEPGPDGDSGTHEDPGPYEVPGPYEEPGAYEDLRLYEDTAPKTLFPNCWNIMESIKIPSKYHLFIKLLDQKKTVFPIFEKFKTRTFP